MALTASKRKAIRNGPLPEPTVNGPRTINCTSPYCLICLRCSGADGDGPWVGLRFPGGPKKTGWTGDDLDVLEINEAFAAQALAVNVEMGWDPARINLSGGANALGHPLAGSGTRIVVELIHEMIRTEARKGSASLCIGGGQGVAICLER